MATMEDAAPHKMSNKSLFVAGAIPAILWTLVAVIILNYGVAPLLAGFFGLTFPQVVLPEWYSSTCSTIILALLAKKAWDSTDLTAGSFNKKAKGHQKKQQKRKKSEEVDCGGILPGAAEGQ